MVMVEDSVASKCWRGEVGDGLEEKRIVPVRMWYVTEWRRLERRGRPRVCGGRVRWARASWGVVDRMRKVRGPSVRGEIEEGVVWVTDDAIVGIVDGLLEDWLLAGL
jgi:hypothetical protein